MAQESKQKEFALNAKVSELEDTLASRNKQIEMLKESNSSLRAELDQLTETTTKSEREKTRELENKENEIQSLKSTIEKLKQDESSAKGTDPTPNVVSTS
jgi:predicted RNase H-like nuclease (RuvC/YqgF family)